MSEKKINQIKDMLKQHYESTRPMDDYFTGMYNGIEAALALIEHREPKYKSVEHRPLEQRALLAEKRLDKCRDQRNALAQEIGQDDDNGAEEIRLCDEQLASITAESGE